MSDITRYSTEVPGSTGNYHRTARFDLTGRFLGISTYDSGIKNVNRVLLSPAQVTALRAFLSAGTGESA